MMSRKIRMTILALNALIGIFGITLVILGVVWLEVENRFGEVSREAHILVSLFPILLGLLMMFTTVLGWCGAIRQLKVFYDMNGSILILSILLYADFGVIALVLTSTTSPYMSKFKEELNYVFKHRSPKNIKFYDYLQTKFSCCGINGSEDYKKYFSIRYPKTCCGNPCNEPFAKGCVPFFLEYLAKNFNIAGNLLCIGACLAIVAAVLTFVSVKNLPRAEDKTVFGVPKAEQAGASNVTSSK